MKVLQRNRKVIYYSLLTGTTDATDKYGNYTGEPVAVYGTPERYERFSYGPLQGAVSLEQYGLSGDYVLPLVTDDLACPITEDARLWIDAGPYDENGSLTPHTHVVRKVIPSVNVVQVLAKEVSVS